MDIFLLNVQEILPDDMPDPFGEAVTTTTTMDANLNHCLAIGKSLTGCLHFVNKTPVDWYSKKQATVETATYGSEFVAAKTATEQIMNIRQTLRYLGAPIGAKSFYLVTIDLWSPVPPYLILHQLKGTTYLHFTDLGKPLLQYSWLSIGSSLPTT